LDAREQLGYENIFRVMIMPFIDAYSFDVRSVKNTSTMSSGSNVAATDR